MENDHKAELERIYESLTSFLSDELKNRGWSQSAAPVEPTGFVPPHSATDARIIEERPPLSVPSQTAVGVGSEGPLNLDELARNLASRLNYLNNSDPAAPVPPLPPVKSGWANIVHNYAGFTLIVALVLALLAAAGWANEKWGSAAIEERKLAVNHQAFIADICKSAKDAQSANSLLASKVKAPDADNANATCTGINDPILCNEMPAIMQELNRIAAHCAGATK